MSFKKQPATAIWADAIILWGVPGDRLELPGTFESVRQANGPSTLTAVGEMPVAFYPDTVGIYAFFCGDFLRTEVMHSSKPPPNGTTTTWSVPATGIGPVHVRVAAEKDLPAWFSAPATPPSPPVTPVTRMTHSLGLGLSIAINISASVVTSAQIVVPVGASVQARYVAQDWGLVGAVASLVGMNSTAVEAAMARTGAIPIALAAAMSNATPLILGVDQTVAGLTISGGWVQS